MKTYKNYCDELKANGGILKDKYGTRYFKPGYIKHRVDGPAVEWTSGNKWWYYNGKSIMDDTKGDATPKQLQEFLLRIL